MRLQKRLSFTRQKVNQIINSLMDLGIVNISIQGYERDNIELECKLEEAYALKQVIVPVIMAREIQQYIK